MDTQENNGNTAPQVVAPETTAAPAPAPAPTAAPVVGAPHENRTLMGVLAYFGILIIIPYLMAKDDSFVHFHTKQGAVICALWLMGYVAGMMVWMLYPLIAILNLGLLALSIVGIVKVVQGKEEPLPIIGSFSKHIPL